MGFFIYICIKKNNNMANIPTGTKFLGVASSFPTVEKKSDVEITRLYNSGAGLQYPN